MNIQINTSSRQVNRYSDFRLTMSLKKNGESYTPSSFVMVFYVDDWNDCASRYAASCLGGVLTNCEITGSNITVFFDHPGFNLGQLKCRVLDMVDDAAFTDGTLDTCTPITLPVEIVAGAGNTDNVVLGYGAVYFGNDHDVVFEGSSVSFGDDNNLEI